MRRKLRKGRQPNRLTKANTKKIVLALLTLRGRNEIVTVRNIMKLSGLSYVSFYTRYRNLKHALARWEKSTMEGFCAFMDTCCGEDVVTTNTGRGGYPRAVPDPPLELLLLKQQKNPNRQAITAWLIFLSHEAKEFTLVAASYENQRILYLMAEKLYERLDVKWATRSSRGGFGKQQEPGGDGSVSDSLLKKLWISHAVAIVSHWGKETNCDYTKVSLYISMLIELTENPSRHCRY